jgi:hypothetical protein
MTDNAMEGTKEGEMPARPASLCSVPVPVLYWIGFTHSEWRALL